MLQVIGLVVILGVAYIAKKKMLGNINLREVLFYVGTALLLLAAIDNTKGNFDFKLMEDSTSIYSSSDDLFIRPHYFKIPNNDYSETIRHFSNGYAGILSFNELSIDITTYIKEDYYPLDSYSKCYLVSSVKGYTNTNEDKFVVSGTLERSFDDKVTLLIYKYYEMDKDFLYKNKVTVSISEGLFDKELSLDYGKGDYKIESIATIKHGEYHHYLAEEDVEITPVTVKGFKVFVRYQ